jgi:hypothetical protein
MVTTSMGAYGPLDPLSSKVIDAGRWFSNICCWKSSWNYQKGDNPQYDDFGNFNYGATGAALGIPSGALMSIAGFKKNIDYWSKFQSNPYSNKPFSNDPNKMKMIAQGIQYAKNGCY